MIYKLSKTREGRTRYLSDIAYIMDSTGTILTDESESEIFIRSYSRPRTPLLRPYLVAVAEATWKNKK